MGTSILLYLSTFSQISIAKSVAWSTVPYVLSLVKFICLGQATTLGFDNGVAMAMTASLALPALGIFIGGPHVTVAASTLAAALLAYGSFGSINPIQSASVEGLDITASPGKHVLCTAKALPDLVDENVWIFILVLLLFIRLDWSVLVAGVLVRFTTCTSFVPSLVVK